MDNKNIIDVPFSEVKKEENKVFNDNSYRFIAADGNLSGQGYRFNVLPSNKGAVVFLLDSNNAVVSHQMSADDFRRLSSLNDQDRLYFMDAYLRKHDKAYYHAMSAAVKEYREEQSQRFADSHKRVVPSVVDGVAVTFRQYADEPLNPRIQDPSVKDGRFSAVLDGERHAITLDGNTLAAYRSGALPVNVLANRVLEEVDRYNTIYYRDDAVQRSAVEQKDALSTPHELRR